MANKKMRLALVGAQGRMGVAISEIASKEFSAKIELVATIDRDTVDTFARAATGSDVFLDVSSPQATEKFLNELTRQDSKVPYVIGCTGWTESQLRAVHGYAKQACVVLAPNFSPGVNLFLGLIERAAPLLHKWGYDAIVHEAHHARKVDSPSGTAKAIVECLGNVKTQIHASRAGNIVGTHEVQFVGPGDILSITHEALDRSIFARGAIMAAEWARQQTRPGLFSMKEVVFGSD